MTKTYNFANPKFTDFKGYDYINIGTDPNKTPAALTVADDSSSFIATIATLGAVCRFSFGVTVNTFRDKLESMTEEEADVAGEEVAHYFLTEVLPAIDKKLDDSDFESTYSIATLINTTVSGIARGIDSESNTINQAAILSRSNSFEPFTAEMMKTVVLIEAATDKYISKIAGNSLTFSPLADLKEQELGELSVALDRLEGVTEENQAEVLEGINKVFDVLSKEEVFELLNNELKTIEFGIARSNFLTFLANYDRSMGVLKEYLATIDTSTAGFMLNLVASYNQTGYLTEVLLEDDLSLFHETIFNFLANIKANGTEVNENVAYRLSVLMSGTTYFTNLAAYPNQYSFTDELNNTIIDIINKDVSPTREFAGAIVSRLYTLNEGAEPIEINFNNIKEDAISKGLLIDPIDSSIEELAGLINSKLENQDDDEEDDY